jgi:hypothetical protein
VSGNDKNLPAPELRRLLRYDPTTGALYWRHREAKDFSCGHRTAVGNANNWNSIYAGKVAFNVVNKKGHLGGKVLGVSALAHRVVWAMETGFWPIHTIDHINGCPADNRLEDLRDVTNAENHRNVKIQSNNKSGFHGVGFVPKTGRWRARIKVDKKEITLGYFSTLDEAINARKVAEVRFGFHPNHGRVRAPLGAV